MSFTHVLLPELHSVVLSFLHPQHLLSVCTHICLCITNSALTPSCFRTCLLLDSRAINALPTIAHSTFSLLTQASALNVQYGDGADERSCRSFFSAASSQSLLDFNHITSLSIDYTDTWEFLNAATPFTLLSALLRHCQAHSYSVSGQLLPCLTHLTIRGVWDYDTDAFTALDLTPLALLQSLTHLDLSFDSLPTRQLQPLLQLPNLQSIVYSNRRTSRLKESSAEDVVVREALEARGVQLLQQHV